MAVFFCLFAAAGNVQAADRLSVKGTYRSPVKIRLSWKWGKGKVKKWKIQRAVYNKYGKKSAFKTIKTIKGKKRAFTVSNLKKEKEYCFRVIGCRVKNRKLKAVCKGSVRKIAGFGPVIWNDYAESDAFKSPEVIDACLSPCGGGIRPDGYRIYRKQKGDEGYRFVKTLSAGENTYRDRNVKPMATYSYRFRAYKVIGKKTYYSGWSATLTRTAVNQTGEYDLSFVERDDSHMVVLLKSHDYNADLLLPLGSYSAEGYGEDVCGISLEKWSHDGENWESSEKTATVSHGQSIYLYMTYNESDIKNWDRIDLNTVVYDGWTSALSLQNGYASAYLLGEYIH